MNQNFNEIISFMKAISTRYKTLIILSSEFLRQKENETQGGNLRKSKKLLKINHNTQESINKLINFDKNVINIDQNIQKQINQLLNMNNKKIGGEGNTEDIVEKTKKLIMECTKGRVQDTNSGTKNPIIDSQNLIGNCLININSRDLISQLKTDKLGKQAKEIEKIVIALAEQLQTLTDPSELLKEKEQAEQEVEKT